MSLTPSDHLTHNLGHQGLCHVGRLLYFFVAYLHGDVEAAEVGNDGYAKRTDATVMGNDDLRNGRHADSVAPQQTVHPVFGRSLEGGALNADVGAVPHGNALFLGYLVGQSDQRQVVRFVHVRETWARREVLAAKRMLWEQVEVVGDNHEVANLELRVHTSGGIADEEGLDAQLVHDANREGYLAHGVPLIEVEAALHSDDVLASEFAENEFPAVTFDRGDGEVWNVGVGQLLLVSYFGS